MTGVPHIAATIERARDGALPGKEACAEAEVYLAAMNTLKGRESRSIAGACRWWRSAVRSVSTPARSRPLRYRD
jgi:hypothetical protein